MTYAHAVEIVENILRNATVLQEDRERIDEALRMLKGAYDPVAYVERRDQRELLLRSLLDEAIGEMQWNDANKFIFKLNELNIAIRWGSHVLPRPLLSPDAGADYMPGDDPNWPPAPVQQGPEGPM